MIFADLRNGILENIHEAPCPERVAQAKGSFACYTLDGGRLVALHAHSDPPPGVERVILTSWPAAGEAGPFTYDPATRRAIPHAPNTAKLAGELADRAILRDAGERKRDPSSAEVLAAIARRLAVAVILVALLASGCVSAERLEAGGTALGEAASVAGKVIPGPAGIAVEAIGLGVGSIMVAIGALMKARQRGKIADAAIDAIEGAPTAVKKRARDGARARGVAGALEEEVARRAPAPKVRP